MGQEPNRSVALESDTHTGLRRVLIVDDNVDSATCLRMLATKSGCITEMAHDGLAAVEAAAGFNPHVVFLDIGLPKLSGYDACRRIRALPDGDKMLIVALTGRGQIEDRELSEQAGFSEHFVKPIDFKSLEKMLSHPV